MPKTIKREENIEIDMPSSSDDMKDEGVWQTPPANLYAASESSTTAQGSVSESLEMPNVQKALEDNSVSDKGTARKKNVRKGKGEGKEKGNAQGNEKSKVKTRQPVIGVNGHWPPFSASEMHLIPQDHYHKYRTCSTCSNAHHWRRMENKMQNVTTTEEALQRQGTSAEKEDIAEGRQYGKYTYTCSPCVSYRDGITLAEAIRKVKQPRTEASVQRSRNFETARANLQEQWYFLCVNVPDGVHDDRQAPASGGPVNLTKEEVEGRRVKDVEKLIRRKASMRVKTMKEVFQPWGEILLLKATDERAATRACLKMQRYLRGERPEDIEMDMATLDTLDEELEEANAHQRGFSSYGANQQKMRNAADYSDRWLKHKKGNTEMEVNVFYACLAGGEGHQCGTVIESKMWDTFKEELEATGQRWYCRVCDARYRTSFGVLMEILVGNNAMYIKGSLPPRGIQDAKMMFLESEYANYTSPKALLDALPDVSPLDKNVFMSQAIRYEKKRWPGETPTEKKTKLMASGRPWLIRRQATGR